MRAPTEKRSTDEIVAEIVKCVGTRANKEMVEELIKRLRADPPPLTGNKKVNTEYATDVCKLIDQLERKLRAPPDPLLAGALFGERYWWLLDAEGPIAQNPIGMIGPGLRPAIADDTRYQQHFFEELDRLRARCSLIIKHEPGIHGGVEHQKQYAAIASRFVMEAARLPLTLSATSPYCRTAALFYEAVTGDDEADLRGACKTVAR